MSTPKMDLQQIVQDIRHNMDKKSIMLKHDLSESQFESVLKESIEKVIRELAPHVERISLFGSYPVRKANLFSDLDILVIMKTEKPFLERIRDLYLRLSLPVDSDILCYTPEEFEVLKKKGFFARALEKEVVLYEKRSAL